MLPPFHSHGPALVQTYSIYCLDQHISNCNAHRNHLGTFREGERSGWDLGSCIPNQLPGEAHAPGPSWGSKGYITPRFPPHLNSGS